MYMADYFGTTSGHEKNMCEDIGVKYTKGNVINVPVLLESPWIYECSLVDKIEKGSGYIYIGEIKNILVDEAIEDTTYGKINMVTVDYKIETGIGSVGYSKKSNINVMDSFI